MPSFDSRVQVLVPSLDLERNTRIRRSSLARTSSNGQPRASYRVHYSEQSSSIPDSSSSDSEDEEPTPEKVHAMRESFPRKTNSQRALQPARQGDFLDLYDSAGSKPRSKGVELTSSRSQGSTRPNSKDSSIRDSFTKSSGGQNGSERLSGAEYGGSRQAAPSVVQEVPAMLQGARRTTTAELIEERRKSQYFATVAKVAFDSEEHNMVECGIGPSVEFFRLLAPSPDAKWKAHPDAATGRGEDANVGRLQLLIPPTVVYSGFEVMGFFTSEDGYVVRKDELHRSDIYQMLLPSNADGLVQPNVPVAVQKLRKGRWRTDAHLVLSSELNSYLDSSKLSGNCAMQQFVKCAGPKVSVVRCVWRASGVRPSQVFIITSRRRKGTRPPNDLPTRAQSAGLEMDVIVKVLRHAVIVQGYLNTIELPRACTVQQVTGRGWAEPLALTQRIAHHVERGRKFPGRFQELVADFVHGEDGRWWFLQVKAFKISAFETVPVSKPLRALTERRAQECRGDYCRTLGMDDNIDAMHQDARGTERRRPKGFDSLSREEKRKYYLDQLDAANRDRPPSSKPGAKDRASPGDVSRALRMILKKSIILDRMEMQSQGNLTDRGPQEGEQQDGPPGKSGASTERSQGKTPRRFSEFLRELEQRREQAKAERQALYKGSPEEEDLEPDPLPKPQRTVPILRHDKLPAFYYELVPVCSDCFRVYLAKDHQRALKEDAARHASPLKHRGQKGTREVSPTAPF